MTLSEIKKNVNLIEYAKNHYDYKCDSKGRGRCLFHHPDNHFSFNIWKDDKGIWRFKDFHDGVSGTIVDLKAKKEGLSAKEAIRKLLKEFNSNNLETKKIKIERKHIYRDIKGQPVLIKIKYKNSSGNTLWAFMHKNKNGEWKSGKGNYELIPYNLDKFENHEKVIICEGEKDADTINALGIGLFATSAPTGKGNWPDCLTKYFEHFKEITFLYDVGNDEDARKHALKLQSAFPNMKIYIAKVPLEQKEADITDYLEQKQMKIEAINDILNNPDEFKIEKSNSIKIETYEDYMLREIPKVEKLVDPFVEKNGFTLIGGMKGIGKSLFVLQMALHLSSGQSGFLNSVIKKPARILLIQQEISEPGLKQRLEKIRQEKPFNQQGRFFIATTTGNPLKLTNDEHFKRIIKSVKEKRVEVLILDPLSTFNPSGENRFQDMRPILDKISELKTKYDLGVVITHHISSKINQDNPTAPVNLAGLFRGHTSLTDSADILIGLLRLPNKQRNQSLPLPYHNYCILETDLRNGERPEKFVIERDHDGLLFKPSNIWEEIGKKILPGEISELLRNNKGEMLQKDLIEVLSEKASKPTIYKAILEAEKRGEIKRVPTGGKGSPLLIKLVK